MQHRALIRLTPSLTLIVMLVSAASGQGRGGGRGGRGGGGGPPVVLRPEHVFTALDQTLHDGWEVVVQGGRITAVGPAAQVTKPADARIVELPGLTLLPGLIEGHSHLLLHPYNEAPWNNQVLNEPLALRIARATVSARVTLMAGITTERDLGTEGAAYADVGLRDAINQGIIPGPRVITTTRAIVGRGAYGVKGSPEWDLPYGAEEVGNVNEMESVVRDQIGRGADWIKLYGDYGWGPHGGSRPTFTEEEIRRAVEITESSGGYVVVHASTAEGMRRAAVSGVATIEHGDGGTPEIFKLMKDKGVGFCPTLAATDANTQYGGWRKGTDPEPAGIQRKRAMFKLALGSGVGICFGGDVGVFTHGDNVRELDLMVDYGMSTPKALLAATSGNAKMFHLADRGAIQVGLLADLIAVPGDPTKDIKVLHNVSFVMKGGEIVKQP